MVSPRPKTLTIQETAEQLNVHYMTAYRYIRQGQLPASRQGTQWLVRQADLDAMRKLSVPKKRRSRHTDVDHGPLERTLLAGDSAGAWWLVQSQLGGALTPSEVLTELVVPALTSIGDRWLNGDISVAEEHRSTAVALRIIGRLGLQWDAPVKIEEPLPLLLLRETGTGFPSLSSPTSYSGKVLLSSNSC